MSVLFYAAAMAQATPHEKETLKNDLVRERAKRHEVAHDILTGQPEKARADHNAAVVYHKRIHRDLHQIHEHDVRRARYHPHHPPHVYVRHHYKHRRHYRHHDRVIVTVRH